MKCPYCRSIDSKVVNKRDVDDSGMIRRRRECLTCKKRFTTYEKVDMSDLVVVKKDGRREAFDTEKLKQGILKACEKRPINMHQIDTMVNEIENTIRRQNVYEINTEYIGEAVVALLRKLDKVACVRFVSVYKSFQTVSEFETEVKNLLSQES